MAYVCAPSGVCICRHRCVYVCVHMCVEDRGQLWMWPSNPCPPYFETKSLTGVQLSSARLTSN